MSDSLQEFLAVGFCLLVPLLIIICVCLRLQLDTAIEQRDKALELYRSTNELWGEMYERSHNTIRNLKKELDLRRAR